MNGLLNSPMFGITLTFVAYAAGLAVARRFRSPLANPMVIAAVLCIGFLQVTRIPLASYQVGGDFLVMLIFPATTCIALSVYAKMDLLKKHLIPILVGCSVGATVSIVSILLFARIAGLSKLLTDSLLPKSVTTAIAIELSTLLGGIPPLTVVAVMITGISIVLIAPVLLKLLRIEDPVVQGIAIGTSSHVMGTAKALEIGPIQGAMSGIAIFITGIATVAVTLALF